MTAAPIPVQELIPCQKCKLPIPTDPMTGNTDNGLHIELSGGYGEFHDSWDGQPYYWLCHECGHQLADWLGIDVHDWHTHNPASGQHPDHHTI